MHAIATPDAFGRPLFLVLLVAVATLLPLVFMTATAFVKVSTVLQITKSALGTQQIPSNTVVMALATAITLMVMAPVGSRIAHNLEPIVSRSGDDTTQLVTSATMAVSEPLFDFMKQHAAPRHVERFVLLAKASSNEPASVTSSSWAVIFAAFLVSELERAFALGVAIFLPFLLLDLVVANVLTAAGLSSLSPAQVSLPFKLLLFVAADGFGLLARSLVLSYQHA
jgi:type III secretion protein R